MSTVYEFEQSESIDTTGGKFVDKPGKYHAIITAINPNPIKKDQTPMLNCLQVDIEILDGTDKTQIERTLQCNIRTLVRDGDKPDSDKALKFKAERLTRFFVAVGFPHVPGQKTKINLDEIPGRQLVVELTHQLDDGKPTKWIEIAGSHIYHVDDPTVDKVPKNADFIAGIPEALRKRSTKIAKTTTPAAPPDSLDTI